MRVVEHGGVRAVEQGRAEHVSLYDETLTPEMITSAVPVGQIIRTGVEIDRDSFRPTFSMYVTAEPQGSRRVIELAFSVMNDARDAGATITNAAFNERTI